MNIIIAIDETIKIGLGNFGRIPYGHTIEGRILFDAKNSPGQYGCEPFNRYTEDTPSVGDSPFILVKKGLCSYTQKVRNIEEAGGHVAIIVNDKDEKVEEMFLADDGHEGDISIPAILISRSDGEKIINYYLLHKDNQKEINKIKLEIKFDIQNKNNTVNYDIWYTPDTESVYSFLKEFQSYQESLGNNAKLGIHMITYPHFAYDPNSNTPKDDCLGSGLYCIRPGKLGIVDGSIIVTESIKQKCLYDISNEQNNNYDNFFKFMSKFHENCVLKENFNQVCSNDAIYSVGYEMNIVNQCLYNSFIATSHEKQSPNYQKIYKNKILDKEYQLRKEYLISRVPSLTINGRLYVGAWKPEFVFDAICAALTKKPRACYTENKFFKEGKGFSLGGSLFIIFIVLLINIAFFCFCKEFIKRKINERIKSTNIESQINTAVNSYIALK